MVHVTSNAVVIVTVVLIIAGAGEMSGVSEGHPGMAALLNSQELGAVEEDNRN